MKLLRLTTLALLAQISCAVLAEPAMGALPSGHDPAVRVQDDLFHAINGGWIKSTDIPADKSRYGSFELLRDLSDQRVRSLIEALAAQPQAARSNAFKIAAYYKSHLDVEAIEKAGYAPIQPLLKDIEAIQSLDDLSRWLGGAQMRSTSPIRTFVTPDARQPTVNGIRMAQSGLGMPDRDYYLKKDDPRMAKAREAYRSYLATLAGITGEKDSAAAVERMMALEDKIATLHWDKVENRDPVKTYNAMTPTELADKAPGLNWSAYLAATGLGRVDRIIVSQPSAIAGLSRLVADTPLADWKLYLRLHTLSNHADVLPQALRDARFAFFGQALSGARAPLPRWQQAIGEVNGALGEAVGELYVAQHFPPEAKARMQTMVSHLMAAYKDSIAGLTWMSDTTKAQAQDKLSKYVTKIGYPEKWRDYSALEVREGDAFGNRQRATQFAWNRMLAKAGKPVDRSEWGMTPQTVNAYYSPTSNEIVFPAAILQPPFFDMKADDAVNFGAIGAVIGHEISHGFDDKGSQYDGDGVLRNWWTPADRQAFDGIANKLVAQYSGYEPLPGVRVNGKLTLGENIADLSGLQMAYKAYLRSLGGKPSPVIRGTTGQQRFFVGWSQSWREKAREERLLQLITTDPHSPGEFRANGAAVNHDGFHEAFGTKEGDKMFKAPAERIRIW